MAINPESQYPGKIAPSSADYPYGQARNITVPGDGTGTPWEAALVNDIFGFQQALLKQASIVPSGSPDKVGESQYLSALVAMSGIEVFNYAGVRALISSGLNDGTKVYVKNSGIAGEFVLDKTDTTTADDGGTVLVATDGARWKRRKNGLFYNLAWFEATLDGVTDCSAALTAANAALSGFSSDGTIVIPGPARLQADVVLDVNILMYPEARLTVDSGFTLTFDSIGRYYGLPWQLNGDGTYVNIDNVHSQNAYNAALSRIRESMRSALTLQNIVGGAVDSFQDTSGIDAVNSLNYNYDSSRTAVVPTRSQANTVYSTDFDNLTGWTDNSTGGATATIVASGSSDPAVGPFGVELDTGASLGDIAEIEQDLGSIPSKFGVMFISKLASVGAAGANAFEMDVDNIDNVKLRIRQRDGAFEAWIDSAWQLLYAGGGNFNTEWWVNVFHLGGGQRKVDLYAGTENVGTYTGVLDAGTVDGRVIIRQLSGSANNRISNVWIMQVGVTQIPDNLTLVGEAVEAFREPRTARISMLFEDVSNVSTPLFGSYTLSVSKDNGVTYDPVKLFNQGQVEVGEIDPAKPMYLFTGEVLLSTTGDKTIKYKVEVTGNQFIGIHGIDLTWV